MDLRRVWRQGDSKSHGSVLTQARSFLAQGGHFASLTMPNVRGGQWQQKCSVFLAHVRVMPHILPVRTHGTQ
eukprot:40765-Pyramimonas_sp.AAC.1